MCQLVNRTPSSVAVVDVVSFCTLFSGASDGRTISYSKYRGSVNRAANTVTPRLATGHWTDRNGESNDHVADDVT